MSEARNIELRPAIERTGAELVVISADDPEAMVRHSVEARDQGYRFAADPSQQIARMSGEDLRSLVEGAELLFTNDYEKSLLESKTGWSDADVLAQVNVQITTHGKNGADIVGKGVEKVHVPVAKERAKVDPTGVGDGFRAGLLAGRTWGLSWERSAQVGSLLATLVLETVGTQEYVVKAHEFADRLAESYGDDAAADVLPLLTR
jgi:adenosine kinase